MIMIYIGIILSFAMLAMISRKHFSKYKAAEGNKSGFFVCLGLAMGEVVVTLFRKRISLRKLKEKLRKIHVASEKKLEDMAREYVIKLTAKCLGIMFFAALLGGLFCIRESGTKKQGNVILRDGYQGGEKEYEIYLDAEKESSVYTLTVAPVEYTEEEFLMKAEEVFDALETKIAGKNQDLEHMYSEPVLPESDETGTFRINWISENPEYVSSSGTVFWEEIAEGAWVTFRAQVQYMEYSASKEYTLFFSCPGDQKELTDVDIAKTELSKLEKEQRNQDAITLPEEIGGVKISIPEKGKNASVRILILGVLLCMVLTVRQYSRLKSEGDFRDALLTQLYPDFVNQMWLFLGAGLTIKASVRKLVSRCREKNILIGELEYALNQMDSGADEAVVYEQLGIRLGIPSYARLMSHISQNLRMGTKNLSGLMEDEVYASMEARKELARRKGEAASTKLLFPMILLLAIVMLIVLIPAAMNF